MATELYELKPFDNNNEEDERRADPCPGNESCSNHNTPNDTEESNLLSGHIQVADSNGSYSVNIHDLSRQSLTEPTNSLGRLKKELNEPVCWRLKVWILILLSLILIFLVIFLSIYFCSVHREDVDDKYDEADFVLQRCFRGNFTLGNYALTQDAQSLSTDSLFIFKEKLTHIFTSSYALGRYFSLATVNPLRNNDSSVEYELNFKMPKENEQLIQYTLSREMVYHVLLQQLYDQDTGDPLYIKPSSLTMEVGS